jgi:hypothetical protein
MFLPQTAPPLDAQTDCLSQGDTDMARVFTFVDTKGVEIHSINDPEDKLPIPAATQVVSIGRSKMWVESVTLQHTVHSPSIYRVRVWYVDAAYH